MRLAIYSFKMLKKIGFMIYFFEIAKIRYGWGFISLK